MIKSGDTYEEKVLRGWEEVYKRGQLTFWVLLALRQGPKHMSAVHTWLSEATNQAFTVEERSLYRVLQRFYEAELVTTETAPGNRGPDKKVYSLSDLGERVLSQFIERNIKLFTKPEVLSLLN